MMGFFNLLIPAILACMCNTGANILWKMQFDKSPISFWNLPVLVKSLLTVNIIGGICLYIISMGLFFYMLSNFRLSSVVPVTSLTYILNIAAAYLIFNEKITIHQGVGTIIIIIGLIVISKSPVIN